MKSASTVIKAIYKASQISKTSQISNTYPFQIKFFHLFRASMSADMNWDSLMGVDGIESLQDLLDKSCTSDNNSQVSGPSRNYILVVWKFVTAQAIQKVSVHVPVEKMHR